MKYILEKWTKDYFEKIDISTPTFCISETGDNVIITVEDEYIEDFKNDFDDQIIFKGMTQDMDEITEFGMKLQEIYDNFLAQEGYSAE